ncbi:GNAT family N-acetyltransferase [Paenibacillus glycanilyticus]|uniref:GNAT family N-acetyltransferase n=1 Tax=Paenibacillus glycanilyticus TaxID=126569 RepID=UPI00203ED283|nr:GNAT family N-acetyltransferase [Paenibacillus glycanilyticus]MCM3631086.1 GNAT family N-acetyltransferase [Paenibacillus glycanilyticus]
MLTPQQLIDIEHLQKECENHDPIQLKLNWEMLRNRGSDQLDFFHYENDELVAFLGLYAFGSTVEVCGMVHPRERLKGHFHQLFLLGMEKIKQNGYKKILLNAPAGSSSAKAFLSNQGAEYEFSEHQMEWKGSSIEETDGVRLRQATSEDYEMCVRISVTAFAENEEDARVMESKTLRDILMVDVNEGTVGKVRVIRDEGQAWIYGFAILPEYQGKGIGRKVLRQIIKEQSSAGYSVHLEVETKNEHALGLYESVGFKVVHSQDYYGYKPQ